MLGRMVAKWFMHSEAVNIERLISVRSKSSPNRGSTKSFKLFFSNSGFACKKKGLSKMNMELKD